MVAVHAALIALAASPFAILGISLSYMWLARRSPAPSSPATGDRPWHPRTPRWVPQPDEAPTLADLSAAAVAREVELMWRWAEEHGIGRPA